MIKLPFRVLAFDFETLQFIADFKTTEKDPNALYFVSSRFHRFFLKNVNPYEINTRIMRIGNVIQSSPSHPFSQGVQPNPQYASVSPASFLPYLTFPYQAQHYSQQNPPSLYNYAQQFPQKFISPFPAHTPVQNSHVKPFYKFQEPSPYAFEQLDVINKGTSYMFQHLNTGKLFPQLNTLKNFNFDSAGEVYRPDRFARQPSHNATKYQ